MKKNLNYYELSRPYNNWHRLLLIMKIIVFLFFFGLINLVAGPTYSQNTKISLNMKDASVETVLNNIENLSEFYFLYNHKLIDVERKVDVVAEEEPIKDILSEIFESDVRFIISDRQIILTPTQGSSALETLMQQQVVTGIVTDASTGEPMPGVNVQVKGSTIGAITDVYGKYSLSVTDRNATLVFSFIGYVTQEIPLNGRTTISVALVGEVTGLDEVVVVGYGTQKKVNLTGAVSTVGSEKLVSVTTPDIANAMIGKLPGLRVKTLSSEPGLYDSQIDIRGWGTMLVIIDGIPRSDFQRIDPSSIDNISILKDASAAVYGVKAANGVMLITTKKGKSGADEITLNSSFGFEYITDYPKGISNSIDNLILKNEAALVDGKPLPYPDYKLYTGEDPNYPNVDWWDLTVRDIMPMSKNDLSFNGGTEKLTYFVSLGNLHQTGFYKTNSMFYNRYNFRLNLTAKLAKGLTANVIVSGMFDKRKNPFQGSAADVGQFLVQPPYESVYANNTPPYYNNTISDRNPMCIINADLTGYRENLTKKYETTLSLAYDVPFIKGLQAKGVFAYDAKFDLSTQWRKEYREYTYNKTTEQYIPTLLDSPIRLQKYFNDWIYWQSQISLDYKKSFSEGTHNIESLLLLDRRDGSGDGFMAQRFFSLPTIDQLNAGLTSNQATSGSIEVINANMALVGRVNYNYREKYLAEFSFRYDGSSLFPVESRWGFFPAISLGWRISEESFIKDNFNFISYLKLRASHGKMGDDSGAGGFQFIQGYSFPVGSYMLDGATLTSGSRSKGLANPNITWYTATTSNIGIDGNLWHGLLDFTAELFQRTREGLLGTRAATLASEFGASFPTENLNSDISRGFEIVVGHSNRINDFSYSIRANLSYSRTKWQHYEQPAQGNSWMQWANSKEGRLTNILWGYGYAGQFQTEEEINNYTVVQNPNGNAALFPGDIKYEDWDEDGMITILTTTGVGAAINADLNWGLAPNLQVAADMHPIGRLEIPETYFGLEMGGAWKGLSLEVLFQGASNFSQWPVEQLIGPLAWGKNSLTIHLDRWHHEDPLDFSTPWVPGKYPITRDGFGYQYNRLISEYWAKDVIYLRLKSIELSYSLPEAWIRQIKLNQVRAYINGFNILTLKSKDVLFDPEHSGQENRGRRYPVMASCNLGLIITF